MLGKLLLALAAVVVVGAAAFYFTQQHQINLPNSPLTQTSQNATPTKITSQNADQTLNQTDQSVGSAMDQMDKDLKAIDQNDTSADNANNI